VATVGTYVSGSNVPAGAFKAQGGVSAWIKDFPFDLTYRVVSFTVVGEDANGDLLEARVQGNTWNQQAANIVRNVKAGQLVTIEDIRAVGPDGRTRSIPSLMYNIK
jgi:hypothetical protein